MYRGASLRLDSVGISITTDDLRISSEFGYGKNEEFIKFFILSYTKFLSDSPLEKENPRPKKLYMSFLSRLCSLKVQTTIRLFSGYAHELLQSEYSTGSDSTTRVYHSFMKDTPIFREYLTWLRTGQRDLLKYVISFLLYGKKLEYEDEDFNATALRGWYDVEEHLRTLVLPPDTVSSLRNIISGILPPLHVDHLLPKFGPGKVAERGVRDVNDKLGSLHLHPRLAYAFDRERPGRSSDQGFGALGLEKLSRSLEDARTKFVRRDIFKSRTICMEPNAFMYFQQEVMRWMVSSMEDGLIAQFVKLDDQSVSQMAAMHGSIYLSTDTIDLSSASDSVHIDLVKQVFPTDYLFYMLATRTSKVRIQGVKSPIRVNKFAPMGSAVCFPTQCILFTAICILGYILTDRSSDGNTITSVTREEAIDFIKNRIASHRSSSTPFGVRYEPPVVYGDDIAVDSRTTDLIISSLTSLGFTVNRSKSFTGSQSFRESCGVYAFEGQDVTPVQFRIPSFTRGKWSPQIYASFIGAYNWHRSNGYHGVASFLLSSLLDYGYNYPLPFTENKDEFGLYTHNLRHNHEKPNRFGHKPRILVRYNSDWQIDEMAVQGIGPKSGFDIPETSPIFFIKEKYRLDQWWRKGVRGTTAFDFTKGLRIRPQETRLRATWARCG